MQTSISKETTALVSSLPLVGGDTENPSISPLNLSSLIGFAYEFQGQELFCKSFIEYAYAQCLLAEEGKYTAHKILNYWISISSKGDSDLIKEKFDYAFRLVRKYNQFGNPSTLEFLFCIISNLPESEQMKEGVRILYDENHVEFIDGYTCNGDPYFQKSLKTIAEVVQNSGRTELTDTWVFALANHCNLLVTFFLNEERIEEAVKFSFCYIEALTLSSNSLFDQIYAAPLHFMAALESKNYSTQLLDISRKLEACFPGIMEALSKDEKYIPQTEDSLGKSNSSDLPSESNQEKRQSPRLKRRFMSCALSLIAVPLLGGAIVAAYVVIAPLVGDRQEEEVDNDVQSCSDLTQVRDQLGFDSWDEVDFRFKQAFPEFEESIEIDNPRHASYRQAWCSIAREWLEEQS